MNEAFAAMLQAFAHFYHMDKANAAIHMADVKFSPITFSLAKSINIEYPDLSPEIEEVISHVGQYQMDMGR